MEATKKKGKPPVTQVTLIIAVMIVAIVGYYCYLVNHNSRERVEEKLTFTQSVLLRDLEKDYPPSPKEVVKYYNEIMKCFYNEDCTEAEIEELGIQARRLYDSELLAYNEWGGYIINLKSEIESYKEAKRRIQSSAVSASTDVDYFKEDGFQFARLRSSYNFLQGKESVSIQQVYLLRKDEDGHWKIYGWKKVEE